MSRINGLTVEWRSGPRRPHLIAAELVVDGRPLIEHCERATGQTFDLVSPFGWTRREHEFAVAQQLLLRSPALLPTGRRELLVCAECADLGCGAISAVIEHTGTRYIWRDIGYENDYDPNSLQLFPMGNFVFADHEVTRLLSDIVFRLT